MTETITHTPLDTAPVLSPLVKPIGAERLSVLYIDGRRWTLLEEFDFASKVLERIVRVPAGFETDFASIPRVLWNLLPPTGRYGKAAVIHDYLYRTRGQATRGDADRVLLEAMDALGVGRLTRWTIYSGVRIGGHGSYKGGL